VDPVLLLGAQPDQPGPVPQQGAELADRRRGDPRLRQQVRPQQLGQDRRVDLVVLQTEVLTRIPATGISRRGGLPLKAAGSGGAIPGREDTGDREPADRADALRQPGRGSSR
jgi:hypothetical protein